MGAGGDAQVCVCEFRCGLGSRKQLVGGQSCVEAEEWLTAPDTLRTVGRCHRFKM